MFARLICLLAVSLVLAEARYYGRRRDDGDVDYPALRSLVEQELERPRSGHRRHRPHHRHSEEDLRELLRYREAEEEAKEEEEEEKEEEEDVHDFEEVKRPSRHRHLGRRRGWSQLQLEEADESREAARDKRHNRRRAWTEQDRKAFNRSRSKPQHFDSDSMYEVEVREAQNSSLCNYTVIPIPDPGGRMPRDLEHVRCNHVGSRCQDKGTYCCIQTYRNVEVLYESGTKEMMKVYSGCVCSLQIYGTLNPYTPDLDLDD